MTTERLNEGERAALQKLLDSDPPTWMEKNFYIPDPRDPITGKMLPPGPIRLHEVQKRILRAALTKVRGRFPYSTVLFSTIKKSGKTRLGAGVAAWYAATQGAYNEIYCLANDGKQSADRILSAIKQAAALNPALQERWHVTKTRIELPNATFIEAIPCDPSGSAGANPGLTVWSEMWGYRHEHKERLWSEMTVPPTRFGHALRWVESYAGYIGESAVLHDLYTVGVTNGARHPAFRDEADPPLYLNRAAQMLAYWDEGDEARRMPWQCGTEGAAYYMQESQILTAAEFDRIHRNQWIDPVNKAIPIEWWDACIGSVPRLRPGDKTPIVIGVDASVSGDCSACVAVSRHPQRPVDETMVRQYRIWSPPLGGKIDLTATIEDTILQWREWYNVVEVAYDEYQLHKMMTDLRKRQILKLHEFGQRSPRARADKQLFDMIKQQQIVHDGSQGLREHVDNAAVKTIGEQFRFVKPDTDTTSGRSRKKRPIDALVALSMANERCLFLNLN